MRAVTSASRTVRQTGTTPVSGSSIGAPPATDIPLDVRSVRKSRSVRTRLGRQVASRQDAPRCPPGPVAHESIRASPKAYPDERVRSRGRDGCGERREERQRQESHGTDRERLPKRESEETVLGVEMA